jgi:hypothetical protein
MPYVTSSFTATNSQRWTVFVGIGFLYNISIVTIEHPITLQTDTPR